MPDPADVDDHRAPEPARTQSLELPVEELMARARPLPPREEMVIENLTEEEQEAFWVAINE